MRKICCKHMARFCIFCVFGLTCCLISVNVSKDLTDPFPMDITWGIYTVLFLTSIRYHHHHINGNKRCIGGILIGGLYIVYWVFINMLLINTSDPRIGAMIGCSLVTAVCDFEVLFGSVHESHEQSIESST
jgi:hypothetical protein